jgi:hypothetical protein
MGAERRLWGGRWFLRWLYVSNMVEFQNSAMVCGGHILKQNGCIWARINRQFRHTRELPLKVFKECHVITAGAPWGILVSGHGEF